MERYEVIVENAANAYILDKREDKVVTLCTTKRPDLGFQELKELVRLANTNSSELAKNLEILKAIRVLNDNDYIVKKLTTQQEKD